MRDRKVRHDCHYTGEYRGAAYSVCNLKHSVLKKILIAFHNGSKYDHHFIIKELATEKKLFTCLGENTEKYIAFTVPIEKEVTRIDKNGDEIAKNISYILRFIDTPKIRAKSLLSNLVSSLFEVIHRIKCKVGHDDKKCEICGIKYKYCDCFLEYTNFKYYSIEYKCLLCNNNCQRKFDEKLKERFFNAYKFCNHNNNTFISLLQKDA